VRSYRVPGFHGRCCLLGQRYHDAQGALRRQHTFHEAAEETAGEEERRRALEGGEAAGAQYHHHFGSSSDHRIHGLLEERQDSLPAQQYLASVKKSAYVRCLVGKGGNSFEFVGREAVQGSSLYYLQSSQKWLQVFEDVGARTLSDGYKADFARTHSPYPWC
jgi:hypothetical protein